MKKLAKFINLETLTYVCMINSGVLILILMWKYF